MRVVVAPDKFRSTATAAQAAAAIANALRNAGMVPVIVPLADGGEGTLEALGGPNRVVTVSGPDGEATQARWRLDGRTAYLEAAQACGLTLAGGAKENDAIAATTAGVGQMITAALEAGATRIILGVGGTATTDGGLGALQELQVSRLAGIELIVACDVRTRFVDAAAQFAPQKGASPSQVKLLERRLERLADLYLEEHGVDVRDLAGAGAAGGLAGGLAAVGASLVSGFEVVAEEVGLDESIQAADLVIVGEGFVDEGSFDGKVVGGVLQWSAEANTPVLVIAGEVFDDAEARAHAINPDTEFIDLVARYGRDRALNDTAAVLEDAVTEWVSARIVSE